MGLLISGRSGLVISGRSGLVISGMNVEFGGDTPEVFSFPCIYFFSLTNLCWPNIHIGHCHCRYVVMVFVLLRTKFIFKEYKHICLGKLWNCNMLL